MSTVNKVSRSSFAEALDQVARSVLMNTAARNSAEPETLEVARTILATKRESTTKEKITSEFLTEDIQEARKEALKWRNVARIRGNSFEGRLALRKADEADKRIHRLLNAGL